MTSASRARLLAVAALGALALSACAAPASPGASASSRACIILPDSASAPRWERDDRPALTKAIETAGFTAAVRNAEGATGSYEQFGEELLAGGCGVMILADLDRAAEKVARSARAAGVPVIAYDRPVKGADYLVAFDHQNTGRLQGEAIVDGLLAAGKDPATSTVYFVGGSPKDTSASLVRAGAVSVMSSAGIVVGAGFDGTGDPENTASRFARELDAKGGKVDAVWVMNDRDAVGVIRVLDSRGIVVPVTGQDATGEGLRNVLRGTQSTTIVRVYADEAREAAKVAIALLFGSSLDPSTHGFLDGTPYHKVPVERIGQAQLPALVAKGYIDAATLCSGLEEQCAALGID